MKKRSFAVMTVLLFMSSFFNINATSENNVIEVYSYECWEAADATLKTFQTACAQFNRIATYEQEFRVWDAAYNSCL